MKKIARKITCGSELTPFEEHIEMLLKARFLLRFLVSLTPYLRWGGKGGVGITLILQAEDQGQRKISGFFLDFHQDSVLSILGLYTFEIVDFL